MPKTLVTGSNRGIGLSLVKLLRARGHDVIAVCRQSSPELVATGARVEADVDVTSDPSMKALAGRLKDVQLDWLIANAGILRGDGLSPFEPASVQEQFEVNALGPLRTVALLRERLAKPSKVALITSRMGSIADNSSGGMYGYRMSKAALNAAGMSLAHDLRGSGTSVAILHPGFVRTGMTGNHGAVDPDDAAKMLIERIEALTPKSSGTFWHANGEVLPW